MILQSQFINVVFAIPDVPEFSNDRTGNVFLREKQDLEKGSEIYVHINMYIERLTTEKFKNVFLIMQNVK